MGILVGKRAALSGRSQPLRYNRVLFRYRLDGRRMKRSDGAKAWSTVLSELAQVRVSVEWERPTWRVSWQDGPTREALMGRAAALGGYRVGAPLPFEDLRFARSDSALAVALAWLARGSPDLPATARAAIGDVEAFCADTGYPQARFDAGALAAAELLRRLGHGDIAGMGALLARAVPPVAAAVMLAAGPELTGRVVTYRWPVGGPPEDLLGPSGPRTELGAGPVRPGACLRCGKPLRIDGAPAGRPARYCGGACRTAAHRARHRTTPNAGADAAAGRGRRGSSGG